MPSGRVAAALIAAAVGLAAARGTAAVFNAQATNATTSFATAALYPPTNLTASAAGRDVNVSWAAGQNGSAYTISGKSNGTSPSCTASGLTTLATTAGTSHLDAARYAPQGTYFCYQVTTTYGAWSSVAGNPLVAAQLGVVVSTVQLVNVSTAGVLAPGDRVVVTFNQPINPASGPGASNSVCVTSASGGTAVMMLASAASGGSCSTSETASLGRLTGISSTRNARYAATYTWSNGNKTLTATVGSRTAGTGNPTITGTATFAPATNAAALTSESGGFHTCDTNAGGGNCLPTATGSF